MPDPIVPISDPSEDLLAVVDHAIDNEGALPPDDDAPELDEAGNPIESEGEGEGEGGEEGEAAPEGEENLDENGNERPRNADGTFKSAEQIAAEAAAAPPVDPKTGKPVVEKKPADPINDPIPKDLRPATQERIRSVIAIAKEAETRATTAETNFNYLIEGVRATGTTPDQYGEMLSFMALFNSQDPAQQEKALELATDFATRLSTLLGKEITMHDPLANHKDLQEAVQKGLTTKQFALEVARNRNQTAFRGELSGQQRQEQEQIRAYDYEKAQARDGLTALEASLRSDPQYAAKKAQLVPILKPIFETMRPNQWVGAFQKAYANLKISAAAPVRAALPKNQPMRAGKGNPGGGSGKGGGLDAPASSALEAMNAALEGMK